MNKAIRTAIIILMATYGIVGITYTIPDKFVSITKCFAANTYIDNAPSVVVDLDGFAKSIGKNTLTWLQRFRASVNYLGFTFYDSSYPFSASTNDSGTWCPNGLNSCGQNLGDIDVTMYTITPFMMSINNPKNSIFFGNQGYYMVAANFLLPNADKLSITKTVKCDPANIVTTNPSLNSTFYMDNSCISWQMGNNLNQIQKDPYNTLVFSTNFYNPVPIPGGSINMFSSNSAKLSINGQALNIAPVQIGNGYGFIGALNFSKMSWTNTQYNFQLCGILAPPSYLTALNITLLDSVNKTLAVGVVSSKSPQGIQISDSPLVQNTTKSFKPVVMSLVIQAANMFNFADSYQLKFVFPSAYSGIINLKITVTSLYDGSVNVVNYSMTSSSFAVTIPSQNVYLFAGMDLKIEGLSNPMFPGNYPISIQVLTKNGLVVSQVINKMIVSVL